MVAGISATVKLQAKVFLQGRYKQSNLGAACFPFTTLPDVCGPSVTGTVCTTAFGAATRTWYQDACQTPYYRLP
ncbi:hypothetical protein F0L74_21600 [Chitinophaga agrisoli]|uniref:Uncharacterized protein n=1 Tax=Chitinophaga agrisoli TaxID=2607653 RepID=A0A5B2VKJ3_9BACT|nr:hypothetical protein [Chitinophaga agrisoli]KAA2238812.1 hypothetical protein F0L74_21600 [Chitinophaga agrisoli]